MTACNQFEARKQDRALTIMNTHESEVCTGGKVEGSIDESIGRRTERSGEQHYGFEL